MLVVVDDEKVLTAIARSTTIRAVVTEEGVDVIDAAVTRFATTCEVGVVVDVVFGEGAEVGDEANRPTVTLLRHGVASVSPPSTANGVVNVSQFVQVTKNSGV